MAHQLESMFYVGETPWHGLGQALTEAPSVADAIKQAGLDWRVVECPIYVGATVGVGGSGAKQCPNHKALVRSTDGSVLGVVGSRYQPLQNAEAFAWFDPLVTSGLVQLETAGSLQDGKRIWVLARIAGQSDISIVGDDVIRKYILLSNSHDGTLAVRVGFTPVRVVCANTLAIAHAENGTNALIRLKHSRSIVSNLDALRDVINVANASFEATAEQFRALASRQINAADLRKYIKTVFGHAATDDKDLSTRAENQIAEVISLFESGRGMNMPGVAGTAWAAYNAVTEYLSHGASDNGDKRYNSLWFGGGATRNADALNEAIKFAMAA